MDPSPHGPPQRIFIDFADRPEQLDLEWLRSGIYVVEEGGKIVRVGDLGDHTPGTPWDSALAHAAMLKRLNEQATRMINDAETSLFSGLPKPRSRNVVKRGRFLYLRKPAPPPKIEAPTSTINPADFKDKKWA